MRTARATAVTALVFLFLAQGQRAYFAALFGLAYDAVFPAIAIGPLLIALLPLAALLSPLLPLTRWLDHRGAMAVAIAGLAVCRVPMTLDHAGVRALSATLVIAFGGLFLTWAIGHIERRALAMGAIAGLLIDQLLRLAGTSWDLSLRPGWLPVQVALSAATLALLLRSLRDREEEGDDGDEVRVVGGAATAGAADAGGVSLERRAGGLRLRNALALGVLLFLELHVLGLSPVVSRWTGVEHTAAALALAVAGALALALAMAGPGMVRARPAAIVLGSAVVAGLFGGWMTSGVVPAALMAAGHGAALLLIARTLSPSSGRRSRGIVTAGLLTFTLFTVVYAASFFYAYLGGALRGGAPWVFLVAALAVMAAALLTPRPPALGEPVRPLVAGAAAAGFVAASALVIAFVQAPQPVPASPAAAAGEGAPAAASEQRFRVATYNIHYGYDEDWRFDPSAIASALEAAGADVVALQEVAAGMPTAYGVDLPLWLERRLGIPSYFAPTINGLQGDAMLSRLPGRGVEASILPPSWADRKQALRLELSIGGRRVDVHALHLDVSEEVGLVQVEAALRGVRPGPAVVLGDLNATEGSAVIAALEAAGFVDAFAAAGLPAGPTSPARRPTDRIDWIRVRGLDVLEATVLDHRASDHRLVVATLQGPAAALADAPGF